MPNSTPHNGLELVIGIGKSKAPQSAAGLDLTSLAGQRRHAADVEAAFTGRPQPYGSYDGGDERVSAATAGYTELGGAHKNGDCNLVTVLGGISAARGCCNLFAPESGAQQFCCGECDHFQRPGQVRDAGLGARMRGTEAEGANG
ncbi:MAG: hypothetical protein ACRD1Y_11210 [Terriglobales bacterium]